MDLQQPEDLLGRHAEFDDRSRGFPARALWGDGAVDWEERRWEPGDVVLDQGAQVVGDDAPGYDRGSCVGMSCAADLAASPARVTGVTYDLGYSIYQEAKTLDQWEGTAYSGTSVLAGAKAMRRRGFVTEYRWAFSAAEAITALVTHGPLIVGTSWAEGMFWPRPSGLLEVTGNSAGGHAYLVHAYYPKFRLGKSEGWFRRYEVVRCRNSWADSWGRKGDFFLLLDDFAALLANQGECLVPVTRVRTPGGSR